MNEKQRLLLSILYQEECSITTRKIFAAFQKAEYPAIKTALDHHFEYRRITQN